MARDELTQVVPLTYQGDRIAHALGVKKCRREPQNVTKKPCAQSNRHPIGRIGKQIGPKPAEKALKDRQRDHAARRYDHGQRQHREGKLSARERLDAVVPMPLDWRRYWQRGFNQSALLARQVGRACGVAMDPFVLLLSPFAPHLAEELWQLLGHTSTLAYEPWPQHDDRYLVENEVEIPVQINGKLRGKVTVPTGADQAVIEAAAKKDDSIAALMAGKTIVKTIVIPGKMVNFVVK